MGKFLLKLRRRTIVRVVTFTLAIITALSIYTAIGYSRADQYQRSVEYTYQRALDDLTQYIDNINISLSKGMYAGTASQFGSIASVLANDAASAKSCLSQLPVSDLHLDNTTKFISQVGDFTKSLAKKLQTGGEITQQERESMQKLADYARQLNDALQALMEQIYAGTIQLGGVESTMQLMNEQPDPSVNDGFLEIEDSFAEYPSLIYDGPFSDHILQQRAKYLEGRGEASKEDCRAKAAQFLSVDAGSVADAGEEAGVIPSYNFTSGDVYINVTKPGGLVSYYLDSRYVGEQKLSMEEAVEKATQFLQNHGMPDMKETYYFTSDGICTINFAYTQSGVTCYTDLIKVGVALDDGAIVLFDARGFVMNHTDRTLETPAVSEDQARETLSELLTVNQVSQALIPLSGGTEAQCYEFRCTGQNEEEILVYVNVKTGAEERILILLKSDGGVLTL